jgi:hypothetical protein
MWGGWHSVSLVMGFFFFNKKTKQKVLLILGCVAGSLEG